MSWWGKFLLALGSLAVMFLVSVATVSIWPSGSKTTFYVIDPKIVVKHFLDQRGEGMSDDAFKAAILEIDDLVVAEAELLYRESGAFFVNKAHVLAGGVDISHAFGERIIQRWDQLQ